MPAVLIQYVSKPKPGGDLAAIIQMSKEAAAVWRKHVARSAIGPSSVAK